MMNHFLDWLLIVHTTDPLRRVFNRGLAILIPICVLLLMLMTVLTFSYAPTIRIAGAALLVPAFAIIWWLNRHNHTQTALATTLLVILATLTFVDTQKYLIRWGQPIMVDISLVFPLLISAFFASPWSVFWVLPLEITLICLDGVYIGSAHDRIANFAVFGSLTLLPAALLIALLAHMYRKALIRSFDENARLAKLLTSDEYTVDVILARMSESDDRRDTP